MSQVLNAPLGLLSLRREGYREAEKHKWIESQKRGSDVGPAALDEWYRRHWLPYCRHKRLEHLRGICCCSEFNAEDFGRLKAEPLRNDALLNEILILVIQGYENLDLILWAQDIRHPMERVIEILEQLNLNCARLEPHLPSL